MAAENTWNSARAGKFVLVVDSEPQNLIFTCMVVQRLDYHACSALGVGSALEVLNGTRPDLIIADLNLKGLSGIDLMERVRQMHSDPPVPVVIMARGWNAGIEEQCIRAGASACLEKPVKVDDLYAAVHPVMDPGTRRRDLRIGTRLAVMVNDRPLDFIDGECATNLSVNGMHLRTSQPYTENSHVRLQVSINGRDICAEAKIIFCRKPDANSGMWGVGLKFLKASPEAGEIIRRFIHEEVTLGMPFGNNG